MILRTLWRTRDTSREAGWSATAVAILVALFATAVIALVAVLGGGRRTVASRSAAAFAEAQRKGIPVGEGGHGHGALSPGSALGERGGDIAAGHAEHGGAADPDQRAAEQASHSVHAMTSGSADAGSPHAGMQHGTSPPGSTATGTPNAGMHHGSPATAPLTTPPGSSTAGAHAGHGAMAQRTSEPSAAPPVPLAERSAVSDPARPAATLKPDPLDAPAETSELDAKRSAAIAAEMGSGGHGMMHGTGSYRQLDAGRDSSPPSPPTAPHHHGTGPQSTRAPTAAPDARKPRPVATPVPTPGGHVHPGGGDS